MNTYHSLYPFRFRSLAASRWNSQEAKLMCREKDEMTVQTAAKLIAITPQFLVLDLQAACAF